MPVHDGSGSNQDERLPPPRPERSQRKPEQLVQGSQSSARALRVQSEQLPTESQVFEGEVLARAKRADDPPEEMSKRHNHAGTTRILTIRRACGAARRVIYITGDLPGSNPRLWSDDEQSGSNSLEGKTDHLLEWPQLLSSRTASPITYSVELHFVSATSPMELAGATGLEPAASCVTGRRSNQLNHARRVPDRAH